LSYRFFSNSLFNFIFCLIFYSFGTFGFFNLFGIRLHLQIFILSLIVIYIIVVKFDSNYNLHQRVFIFASLLGIGGFIYGSRLTAPVEGFIIFFIIIGILSSDKSNIILFSKTIVLFTFIFSLMISISWFYFYFKPETVNLVNIHIYDSTTGTSQIYPHFFTDWLSFTSGDGFVFLGQTIPRFKGYSNEPSATLVHYLAPSIIGLLLGGKYKLISFFLIFVNVAFIGSFTSQIVILFSVILFLLLVLYKKTRRIMTLSLFLFSAILLFTPIQFDSIIKMTSDLAVQNLNFDMISRKINPNKFTGVSNLEYRAMGISAGLKNILYYPLGYSSSRLGTGPGLIYTLSSKTGWIGLFIFINFMFRFFKNIYKVYISQHSLFFNYAIAMILSLLFVSFFINGYGWDRPPGFIIIFVLIKLVSILNGKINSKLKYV